MLVNGRWTSDWQPVQAVDAKGGFVRQASSFRSWITPDGAAGPTGAAGFKAERGRYHLYVALICPWASRTLLVRKVKRLEDVIGVTVADPELSDQGWKFGGSTGTGPDAVTGVRFVHELYTRADPGFSGRATVPVLWDKKAGTIVNNESADIVRILNSAFAAFTDAVLDLYPLSLREEIDAWIDRIYPALNNGVYRAGFATTQVAYEEAFAQVFGMLDVLEPHLFKRSFLVGDVLTEADIRLFVTLIRFDVAYHGLFKCNLRRLSDYEALTRYTKRIYSFPGVRETVDFDHIKRGYYSIKALNPNGIVPRGPALDPQIAW